MSPRYKACVSALDALGLGLFLRPLVRCLREQWTGMRRAWRLLRRRGRIRNYLATHGIRKLHLGASNNTLAGWLNTDLEPASPMAILMDASAPFPLPNESFDYVFSEHFIEHLNLDGAARCFAEVFRCLTPGGVFRLATPDLDQYIGLFSQQLRPEQLEFLRLFAAFFNLDRVNPCRALNHLAYNWGHQFLYTEEELVDGLRRAGFTEIVRAPIGDSRHENLRGLEQHAKFYGDVMNRFETMVLEASKPFPNVPEIETPSNDHPTV